MNGHGPGIWLVAPAVVGLMLVAMLGSWATDRDAGRTQRAVLLNTAYQQAARGVAAEESLERDYRLEPGPEPLAGHTAAERAVVAALGQVRRLGGAPDRALVALVLGEQARYVEGEAVLFAAVDAHQPIATIDGLDAGAVDPIFDRMQTQIIEAAARHQAQALRQVSSSRRTSQLDLWLDAATVCGAVLLIGAAATRLSRSRRRLRAQSDLNQHQALHDGLTGLPNRALFQDRTAHALRSAARSGEQVAVLLIDLNRFKDVNDTLGHHYGDLLLQQVAERFTAVVRAGDSVARLGGDEFAVLLHGTSAQDAVAAAGRLTRALERSFCVKDISLDVEASVGIALAGPDADVETAIRHADVAMYEAKSQHVPFATYELTRDDNTVGRLALLGDLRRAIGTGGITLHYQPKVTTAGEVHSVEALVRWQHPTRGLLLPDVFVPVAEHTAVIHPLTAEILRQALVQVRTWLDRGWSIPVAVNISARSLLDLDFPEQVRRSLECAGVPARLLALELTESAMMSDPARALLVLDQLDAMGVVLSIDDFGTGFSSMAYLKALPVKELKIDRSFVAGMTTDESDTVLVQSTVDLGHNLGLHVVAEGVEDAATQAALTALGCDLLQGYHIRRPVPAAELEPWLRPHLPASTTPTDPAAAG